MPGAAVLQKVERWRTILVDGHDLAIDNRFVGQSVQSASDGRESFAEILPVARREVRAAVALDSNAAVAVKLELQLPLRTLGLFGDREAEHRFEESGVHSNLVYKSHRQSGTEPNLRRSGRF
jgi:hypothetical protein